MKRWISLFLAGCLFSVYALAQLAYDDVYVSPYKDTPQSWLKRYRESADTQVLLRLEDHGNGKWRVVVDPPGSYFLKSNSLYFETRRDPADDDFWQGVLKDINWNSVARDFDATDTRRIKSTISSMGVAERTRNEYYDDPKRKGIEPPYRNDTIAAALRMSESVADRQSARAEAKDSADELKRVEQRIKKKQETVASTRDNLENVNRNIRKSMKSYEETRDDAISYLQRRCGYQGKPPTRRKADPQFCERRRRTLEVANARIAELQSQIEKNNSEIRGLDAELAPDLDEKRMERERKSSADREAKGLDEEVEQSQLDAEAVAEASNARFYPSNIYCCPSGVVDSMYPQYCAQWQSNRGELSKAEDVSKIFGDDGSELDLYDVCRDAGKGDKLCRFTEALCLYRGKENFVVPFTAPKVECVGKCDNVTSCARANLDIWSDRGGFKSTRSRSGKRIDVKKRLQDRGYDPQRVRAREAK